MKQKFPVQMLRISIITGICLLSVAFNRANQKYIPIWFDEYGVEIRAIGKIGDTLFHNKSSTENFKFVFFNTKGRCYCEHYLNGKLYERGNFENSLDTLKRYVSRRSSSGQTSPIEVQKYFGPLKNGEWMIYKGGKLQEKQQYILGLIQDPRN